MKNIMLHLSYCFDRFCLPVFSKTRKVTSCQNNYWSEINPSFIAISMNYCFSFLCKPFFNDVPKSNDSATNNLTQFFIFLFIFICIMILFDYDVNFVEKKVASCHCYLVCFDIHSNTLKCDFFFHFFFKRLD